MSIMRDFRKHLRGSKNWSLPTIIVQSVQARYRPPQNPPGCLQILQAINVPHGEVGHTIICEFLHVR